MRYQCQADFKPQNSGLNCPVRAIHINPTSGKKMSDFYSFSDEAVHAALESAKQNFNRADSLVASPAASELLSVGAECISVSTQGNQVCINLPLGFGQHCFSLPITVPSGSVGQACLSICTKFGLPTGVRITITFAGVTVINQAFGLC
jgi:hypothetical protein